MLGFYRAGLVMRKHSGGDGAAAEPVSGLSLHKPCEQRRKVRSTNNAGGGALARGETCSRQRRRRGCAKGTPCRQCGLSLRRFFRLSAKELTSLTHPLPYLSISLLCSLLLPAFFR